MSPRRTAARSSLEIADQIAADILTGAYPQETPVPSTNELSVHYRVNPATAGKALNLLVDDGVLYKRRGLGVCRHRSARGAAGSPAAAFVEEFVLPSRRGRPPGLHRSRDRRLHPQGLVMTAAAVPPRERGITLHAVTKSFGGNHAIWAASPPTCRLRPHLWTSRRQWRRQDHLDGADLRAYLPQRRGQILIDGEDPVESTAMLRRTCLRCTSSRTNDNFTVAQVLAPGPAYFPNWSAETAERLARRFRLPPKTASKLSRGQRSALAITISLASRAPYLPRRALSRAGRERPLDSV